MKNPVLPRSYRPLMGLVWVIGSLLLADLLTFVLAERQWFAEVNFLQVFDKRILVQLGLGLISFCVSLAFLWMNQVWAHYHVYQAAQNPEPPRWGQLRLPFLLPLVLVLSFLVGLMLLYHAQIAASHWHPRLTLYVTNIPVPVKFRPDVLGGLIQGWAEHPWQGGLVTGLAIALLIFPGSLLWAIAILLSAGFALVLFEHWWNVLPWWYRVPFGDRDPLFGHDIGAFVFLLPILELLEFWLIGLFAQAFLAVSLIYLLEKNHLSNGVFPGFSPAQQRHLYALGGCLMLAIGLTHWLDRYNLLYSTRGAVYGASFTDVHVGLPLYTVLSFLAVVSGVLLLLQSRFWHWSSRPLGRSIHAAFQQRLTPASVGASHPPQRYQILTERTLSDRPSPSEDDRSRGAAPSNPSRDRRFLSHSDAARRLPRRLWLPLIPFTLYLLLLPLAQIVLPTIIQGFVVQPNELELERPYIERAIALTRRAFNLETIASEDFNPQYTLTLETLEQNDLTVDNIRLWDGDPLLAANRQLQRFRPYYEFFDADIDRYILPNEEGRRSNRQVLIAARELDYNSVPQEAKTWVNEHLIYTHGYGFTLSPVNVAAEGGLPDYFVRGIEQSVNDARVYQSIPLGKPRIYYGELTNTYIMTETQVREFDYPSGETNVYTTYDGLGGISISNPFQRLLYAKHLRDWRMLFTEDFTPQTRLLFRRNILDRVRAIAPFLRYDRDPYLVVADLGSPTLPLTTPPQRWPTTPNYLYWVLDAYTTSDRYPYSDAGGNDFNYIRNSVKVLVDAYNGTVQFYVADSSDPLIQTWSRVFPGMFQPLTAMPVALKSHLRYPQDYYSVQSAQLMVYHMTDPQVFYNREDQWRAPNEIYGDELRPVEPYYLIMKLPTGTGEEFILFSPFTPNQRTNLIGWLAARSDGENYGRMLLYRFPKQELVFGPEQLEARINQDPTISQQISLWNRRGSRAIQGNLLVIPIERSLLYAEPLYLAAEQNRIPTLVRVIIAYANRIAMAETLEEAIEAVFRPEASTPTTIVRPLEDEEAPVPSIPPLDGNP